MKFYQMAFSHYCAKVRVVLLEKRLSFELPPLPGGSTRSAEFLAINPQGQVPVLVDGDTIVAESEVIAEYLEDAYPETPLLPPHPAGRAASRGLSRFHDLHLAPQLTTLYRFLVGGRAGGDPEVAAALDRLDELLALLENRVAPGPYLLGERFLLCDAAFALSHVYAGLLPAQLGRPVDPARTPRLSAWFAAVASRPSVAETLAAARQALGMPPAG